MLFNYINVKYSCQRKLAAHENPFLYFLSRITVLSPPADSLHFLPVSARKAVFVFSLTDNDLISAGRFASLSACVRMESRFCIFSHRYRSHLRRQIRFALCLCPLSAVVRCTYLQSCSSKFLHSVSFCFFRWRTAIACSSFRYLIQLVHFARGTACPPCIPLRQAGASLTAIACSVQSSPALEGIICPIFSIP